MRVWPAAVVLGLVGLTGCSGGSGSSGIVSNQAPTANVGGPYAIQITGVGMGFNGSTSSDPQSEPLTYAWNFGDNTTGTGSNPGHTYTTGGTFTVTLTVTDTSGLIGSATTKVTVYAPPSANIVGPTSGAMGTALNFSGTGSTDPQGLALTYTWSFGDGTPAITGATVSHIYGLPGTYTAGLTVKDTAGLSGTVKSGNVTVLGAPIANAGAPYSRMVGLPINFSATGSSDPQGQALAYEWNFGDGSTGTGASPSHSYAKVGTYAVSLTVTNTSGLTGTATTTATVVAPLTDVALTGTVYNGVQPVSGAHVYLLAANTLGYGGAGIPPSPSIQGAINKSISLLDYSEAGVTNSGLGAYVTTDANGAFSMTGEYTCTSGQQMYLYAASSTATSDTLMAVLGACPGTSGPAITATVNEVSTVAAAYSMAGFASSPLFVSSTTAAKLGIANAFANAANLETLSTGIALATTPAGNGGVPLAEINTLANILASCSGSGSSCTSLFADVTPPGTPLYTGPGDTAAAAISIAQNPALNVAALYALGAGGPFSPVLTNAPNDWTIALNFTAGGLNSSYGIAIDGVGNVWIANILGNSVTELSPAGVALSGNAGFTDGSPNNPTGVAIDTQGNAWVTNDAGGKVIELSNTGSAAADPNGYVVGTVPYAVAVDGSNNVWVANELGNNTSELNGSTGASVGGSPFGGGGQNKPYAIAIDSSGAAWVADYNGNGVTSISNTGIAAFYNGGIQNHPDGIAIDASGAVWIANAGNSSLTKLSSNGTTGNNYVGGGLSAPGSVSIDGAGNVWASNASSISEFSNAGVALTPATGFEGSLANASALAIDSSGDVWVANNAANKVTEFVGVAAPVATPLAVAVKNNTLGTRP